MEKIVLLQQDQAEWIQFVCKFLFYSKHFALGLIVRWRSFKIETMNETILNTPYALLEALQNGYTVKFIDLQTLARFENDIYYVTGHHHTLRLDEQGFLDLYGHYPGQILKSSDGIDEKKDEEYYAWRREKQ